MPSSIRIVATVGSAMIDSARKCQSGSYDWIVALAVASVRSPFATLTLRQSSWCSRSAS
jgi:hypothetical protein